MRFVLWFLAFSLALGWIFWTSSAPQIGVSMLVVPAVSTMLASQGFRWKRKLSYAAATVGLYILGSAIANAVGVIDLATEQINAATSFPSLSVVAYTAYLTTFPFAMLVLFVGRNPRLLWTREQD